MLVLTRRIGDEIVLPELGIKVRLLKVKGKTAVVGVDAPDEFRVLRGELTQFDSVVARRPQPLAASA